LFLLVFLFRFASLAVPFDFLLLHPLLVECAFRALLPMLI